MNEPETIKLNLGCGDQRLAGFIGLDCLPRRGTDLICDLAQGIPVVTGSVDHIYAKSILEHIYDLESILREIVRVLMPGGTVHIYAPHWSNPFYYSDYTHRRFFGLASFDYFARPEKQIYRAVPTYTDINFQTDRVRLLFHSPFRWANWFMKGLQWLVNQRPSWQLFFEYHLSSLVPCYAVEYILRRE